MGSVIMQGLFDADFCLFLKPGNLKISIIMLDHVTKMVDEAMYFVAWYTLPFFRELNLYLE